MQKNRQGKILENPKKKGEKTDAIHFLSQATSSAE